MCYTHLSAHIITDMLREADVLRQSTCSQNVASVSHLRAGTIITVRQPVVGFAFVPAVNLVR